MAVTAEEPARVYDEDECLHISLRRSVFYNCCLMNDILGSFTGSYPLLVHAFVHQE